MTDTPQPETEEVLTHRSNEFKAIERRLKEWQRDDFVMPGWQIVWDGDRNCLTARFHLNHNPLPYTLTAYEFEMYQLGFQDRRSAVMNRKPRPEVPRRKKATAPAAT